MRNKLLFLVNCFAIWMLCNSTCVANNMTCPTNSQIFKPYKTYTIAENKLVNAESKQKLGKGSEAMGEILRTIQMDPINAAKLLLGEKSSLVDYYINGNWMNAIVIYKTIAAKHPADHVKCYIKCSDIFTNKNKLKEGIKYALDSWMKSQYEDYLPMIAKIAYLKEVRNNPTLSLEVYNTIATKSQVAADFFYLIIGQQLMEKDHDYKKANVEFWKLYENNKVDQFIKSEAAMYIVLCISFEGKPDDAIKLADRFSQEHLLYPGKFVLVKGRAMLEKGSYEEAGDLLEDGYQKYNDYYKEQFKYYAALSYLKAKKWDKALEVINHLEREKSNYYIVMFDIDALKFEALVGKNNIKELESFANSIINDMGRDIETKIKMMQRLAGFYMDNNEKSRAISTYDYFLNKYKGDLEFTNNYDRVISAKNTIENI